MQIKRGLRDARLIDDSYNANPGSVRAAIDTLAGYAGRRLLVLGDMAELGPDAAGLHREVGAYAASRGLDGLYTCGPLSQLAAETFGACAAAFADKAALGQALVEVLDGDTTVLVKGSRAAGMEDIVHLLEAGGERHAVLAD